MTYSGSEKRRFKRVKVKFPVLFSVLSPFLVRKMFEDREFEAKTRDLSEGGVTLQAGFYLPVNTELLIKFITHEVHKADDKNKQETITMKGRVVTVTPAEQCNYFLGISFGQVDEEKQAKFFDLICSPEIQP